MTPEKKLWRAAAYCRLSREDGDRPESDSVVNQRRCIEDFCRARPELRLAAVFTDDGATGTNFARPGFRRMLADIEAGKLDCVIVKDLSRFGRDYIGMGWYLERYFPERGVRFLAVNDGVDSESGPYSLLLPLQNVFNAQYARDISDKVRSAIRAKQRRGEFCGAFAPYGYRKDPENRNRLLVDPAAAEVVRRVFRMAAEGVGQARIARALNEDGVPSPGDYKRLMGLRCAGGAPPGTAGRWTYAAVHKLLRSETYLGSLTANRTARAVMHGKARAVERSGWIVAEGTHEPIVSRALWDAAQAASAGRARSGDPAGRLSLFAGFLRCGDCGAAMTRTARHGGTTYACGAYQRRGSAACASHSVREDALSRIVLADLNRVLARAGDLGTLAERAASGQAGGGGDGARQLEAALARVRRLRQDVREDVRDGLLRREEFLCYREDYAARERTLNAQLAALRERAAQGAPRRPWTERLLREGRLTELDRATLAQTVAAIRVFEGGRLEIDYRCSEALRAVMEARAGENGRSGE